MSGLVTLPEGNYSPYSIPFPPLLPVTEVSFSEELEKIINICYEEKYKLSDIAKLILIQESSDYVIDKTQIQILNNELKHNYSGDNTKLRQLNLPLLGLTESLKLYEKLYNSLNFKNIL